MSSGSKRRVIESETSRRRCLMTNERHMNTYSPLHSDSSSDSDDDVPLSKLRADARAGIDITVKPESSSATVAVMRESATTASIASVTMTTVKTESSTTPAVKTESNGASATAPAQRSVVKREVVSDSDDDVPISGLRDRKKLKLEVKTSAAPAKSSSARPPSVRTPTRPKKRVIKIKYKQQECTEELYQTLKGRLTQELLCRWWYALEWPPAKAKESKLHGVQELDGFRGAYIRVRGDEMGSIVDTRPALGKPSFLHFFAMPSAEIQKLLVKAYEKQIEALIEHEGEDAPLLKELRAAKASAAKIVPEKADRSVQKVLKGYKELAEQLRELEERMLKEENTATEEEEEEDDDDDDDDDDDE